MMENRQEKIDLIKEIIYSHFHFTEPGFDKYLISTLERLPFKDLEYFAYERNVFVFQAGTNYSFQFDPSNLGSDITIIVFTTDILNLERHEITYIIAHEFAHAYLKHPPLGSGDEELEADRQVIKWGFEKELK